jgi:type IV pilus assembly protein PilY1
VDNVRKLVKFIRGHEDASTGYRTRTIDYDADGVSEVWRQGDTVHSSPIVVVAPNANYDTFYGDNTYAEFREKYKNRRQMVYVGGNDGMVHAFNSGFWDSANSEFKLKLTTEVEHPLGAEMWAYIPGNLLPHLRFLADPNYPHVYYVDGPARAFDANIFTPDSTHPNGWGTILVMGMRMGGKRIGIDADGDANNGEEIRSQSAYMILDITDPEQPPQLFAEISTPTLHFTTSQPSLVKQRVPDVGNDFVNPSVNQWYLAFGSGPQDSNLNTAESTQNAKFYLYDLVAASFVSSSGENVIDTADTSFVGNPLTVDWNGDYVDDAVYFGTVEGTVSAPAGSLQRLRLSDNTLLQLIDPGQPFISRPSVVLDRYGNHWIHAGTGRLLVSTDNKSTAQQSFYGVFEPKDAAGDLTWATLDTSDLQNVTNVQVKSDATILDPGSVLPAELAPPDNLYENFAAYIRDNTNGWFVDFHADGTSPSARNVTQAVQVSSVLVFTDYTPFPDICEPEGDSSLYAMNFATGTAAPYGALGIDPVTGISFVKTDLGKGLSSAPTIHRGSKNDGRVTGITQQSTASVTGTPIYLPPTEPGRQSWREIQL